MHDCALIVCTQAELGLHVKVSLIHGMCLQVNIRVECSIAKDTLKGDDATELHLKLLSLEAESYPFKDDE